MKKYTIEATEENVLESIEHDVLNRSEDVRDFITTIGACQCALLTEVPHCF